MKIIVTGGAGFIGSNAASRYLSRGDEVVIIDNLSRPGGERNLEWLKPQGQLAFLKTDIRNADQIKQIFKTHRDAGLILHLAGQVAVTTSVSDPRSDFEANAIGTFNVLEAARLASIRAPIILSSTNKVYGAMEEMGIVEGEDRYAYSDLPNGVSEQQNLDFHSPYGCSKGAADQYVRDYHRIYGLETVVFRQSCVYGHRQFGVEDQGWVAWFIIAALLGANYLAR
jgi:CDP-paratose 2-epimerase